MRRTSRAIVAVAIWGALGTTAQAASPPTGEQIAVAEAALQNKQGEEAADREEWSSRELLLGECAIAAAERIKWDKANQSKESADRAVGEFAAELQAVEETTAAGSNGERQKARNYITTVYFYWSVAHLLHTGDN